LPGRPSKSLTLDQAVAVLHAASRSRLYAYVVLSLACGARTEELRAVTWADLDLEEGVLSVVRSVRDVGKLKTIKSHRRLALLALAVTALKAHKLAQAPDAPQGG
jgi:integrase